MKHLTAITLAFLVAVSYAETDKKTPATPAAPKDPTLAALEAQAKKQHNRAVVIDKTARRYSPETRPELIVRDARQSFQERLNNARATIREEVKKRIESDERLVEARQQLEAKAAELQERLTELQDKTARLERLTTYLEGQRDSARLSTTKAIYQAILDKLNAE